VAGGTVRASIDIFLAVRTRTETVLLLTLAAAGAAKTRVAGLVLRPSWTVVVRRGPVVVLVTVCGFVLATVFVA
jgi:hypothetical protein